MMNLSDRRSAAANPTTPTETLRLLARDKDPDVRQGVAGNPSATAETLRMLAGDGYWPVRLVVAMTPSTPDEVLAVLACDSDEEIAGIASRALAWSALEACGGTEGMNREEFMARAV